MNEKKIPKKRKAEELVKYYKIWVPRTQNLFQMRIMEAQPEYNEAIGHFPV